MKANYTIDAGDLRVIRPLVTCREQLFRDFAEKYELPIIADNCPACFSAPKERHRVKLMLAQQENLFPNLFQSILKSIEPLMRGNIKDILAGKEGAAADLVKVLGGVAEEDDDAGAELVKSESVNAKFDWKN